jgi:thiol-disulfide isomerase/thioredoxin
MRGLFISPVILGLLYSAAVAQEKVGAKAARDARALDALTREYEAATKTFAVELRKAYGAAKKSGKQQPFDFKKEHPARAFSKKFLALAEKDPEGQSGLDALVMALKTSGGPDGKPGTWAGAIKLLREHYADKPGLRPILAVAAGFGDEAGDRFARDVIAKNPDRELQAKAYRSLAEAREEAARTAKILKGNDELRERFEKMKGKQAVAEQIAKEDAARAEADEFRKTLREKYGDLVADLSIGRRMPELVSEGLDGKAVRLGDLKGKVVVLDVWATWCGPCRAMIPHEQEMVERLKDKPFELVSISADEEKKTLTDFLAKEKMPWTHWWSGTESKLMDTLDIRHFPTVFVLDAEGTIRHKEIRGEELDQAVDALLDEAAARR